MKQNKIYEEEELLKNSPLKQYGRYINLNGVNTFITDSGEGENLILANGIAASVYTWRKVIPGLSSNFHVFGMDFKGTGFSEKAEGEYSIEMFTTQMFEFMKYFNIDKVVLVGNSLGGEVVLDFAIKHSNRVKALVLIDTAGYQYNKEVTGLLSKLSRFEPVANLLKKHASRDFTRKIIDWATYNENIINEDMVDGYYKPMRTKGAFEAFIELVRNLSYTEFDYGRVKDIKAPTLIIWGTEDKWIPVEDAHKFHRDIKNSKLVLLNHCGHAPQEEMPERVVELIIEFIEELKGSI